MQIRLSGETPFQVLSTTFTIGPSTSGYDLMFSADGVNYSKLFTVGANVNRQVTQVAAGSYYYLSGNTGNVVVNWFGNCVSEGSGGGGGTQYTAGNGIQISGSAISVKAGEGLAFSGDTLVASGGSAEGGVKVYMYDELFSGDTYDHTDLSVPNEMVALASGGTPVYVLYRDDDKSIYMALTDYSGNALHFNGDNGTSFMHCTLSKVLPWMMSGAVSDRTSNYLIVEALSAVTYPVEGMMASTPSYIAQTFTGTKLYISDFEHFTENTDDRAESYLARVHWGDWDSSTMGEEDLLAANVYQSGDSFHWDWENDGNIHTRELERDGYYYTVMYKCVKGDDPNGSEAYFEFYPVDETPYGDYIVHLSNYVATAETTYDVVEPAAKYTYTNVDSGSTWVKQQDSHYLYIGDWGNPSASVNERVAFYNAVMANTNDHWYMDINGDGLNRCEYHHMSEGKPIFTTDLGGGRRLGFALNGDGSVDYYSDDRVDIPGQSFISITSGGTMRSEGLDTICGEQPYRVWLRCDTESSVPDATNNSYAPLKYIYRQYETIYDEPKLVYYICAEIMIGGTLYKGTWHFIEWEWGETISPDIWTSVQ